MAGENYINHIALVLDESSSMSPHARDLVAVADAQVAHLARRSTELDQETRVSVYTFADTARCRIFDKDVLRLPSMEGLYRPSGRTALIDATLLSLEDLVLTSEKYGDHAFLIFVLTDGEENQSRRAPAELLRRLNGLRENWTVAVLVPNQLGKHEAKRFGFPGDNIAIWDPSGGVAEAGEVIRNATESFMTGRASGVRGSRNIFSTSADAVNKAAVKAVGLAPLAKSAYRLIPVPRDTPIRDFVLAAGYHYQVGRAFYPLTKTESIQANKALAVLERNSAKVFVGDGVRDMVGLPDMEVRVKPDWNTEFTVYVQSTSVNRVLKAGTKLLLLVP